MCLKDFDLRVIRVVFAGIVAAFYQLYIIAIDVFLLQLVCYCFAFVFLFSKHNKASFKQPRMAPVTCRVIVREKPCRTEKTIVSAT